MNDPQDQQARATALQLAVGFANNIAQTMNEEVDVVALARDFYSFMIVPDPTAIRTFTEQVNEASNSDDVVVPFPSVGQVQEVVPLSQYAPHELDAMEEEDGEEDEPYTLADLLEEALIELGLDYTVAGEEDDEEDDFEGVHEAEMSEEDAKQFAAMIAAHFGIPGSQVHVIR